LGPCADSFGCACGEPFLSYELYEELRQAFDAADTVDEGKRIAEARVEIFRNR
jgi:hypothetical protein